MRKQKEIEQIKKLIQNGFDLKLISFELDIPIEELIQYKIELETSKADNRGYSKISEMREKYRQLYFRSNKVNIVRPKELSQEEMELIKTVITSVEEKIEEMKNLPQKEKKYVAGKILSELKKVEEYQLPMAQAEQLYMLMCSQELQNLSTNVVDRIDYYIENHRKRIASNYAKAIEFEQYDIDDIERLKVLERKITSQMIKENPLVIDGIKGKISTRIVAIKQQKAIDRIRNDIPTSIISIIQDLVDGNIDIENAKAIIGEEARKRVENKPRTLFSLTEEQERKQILIQMRMAIAEKADRFQIQNPERTILQMQELCGMELEHSIGIVVKNLIQQKKFETAKNICDKFSKNNGVEDTESEYTKSIRGIRNDIRNAEISDIVMKAINMNGTPEEDEKYFSLIEKGIKMGKVNLKAILLGKSEDGIKNITLADVWCDENEKVK